MQAGRKVRLGNVKQGEHGPDSIDPAREYLAEVLVIAARLEEREQEQLGLVLS